MLAVLAGVALLVLPFSLTADGIGRQTTTPVLCGPGLAEAVGRDLYNCRPRAGQRIATGLVVVALASAAGTAGVTLLAYSPDRMAETGD